MRRISREGLISLVEDLFAGEEFNEMFDAGMSLNDKIHYLTSESMLALLLVTTIEDELEIELADDEIDLAFFSDIDVINTRVQRHLS